MATFVAISWTHCSDGRVCEQERTNGIARVIAGSNRKGPSAGRGTVRRRPVSTRSLPKLRAEHAAYRQRRAALAIAMATCEAADIPAMRVTYELLVQQPHRLQEVLRFVDVDSELTPNGTTLR